MDERPPNLWQAYRIRHGDIDAAFKKVGGRRWTCH